MATPIPQVEVYYIEFPQKATPSKKALSALKVASRLLVPGSILPWSPMGIALSIDMITSLKRLVDDNRFFVIDSPEELSKYKNAYNNDWVINSKKLKKTQYYIRHPKLENRHLLIEAQAFHEYIEEEFKDELVDFIMAHCPVTSIQINRMEQTETKGNVGANVKGADISASAAAEIKHGNFYSAIYPNGVKKTDPRPNYYWIDKSIMRSIEAMTTGSLIQQEYKLDMTFGLSLSEAKTVGVDLSRHKKYTYTIQIET